jgi:hypothetical protein
MVTEWNSDEARDVVRFLRPHSHPCPTCGHRRRSFTQLDLGSEVWSDKLHPLGGLSGQWEGHYERGDSVVGEARFSRILRALAIPSADFSELARGVAAGGDAQKMTREWVTAVEARNEALDSLRWQED